MFERVALVHYHEIGLKGNNRSTFENRLRLNIDSALEPLGGGGAYRVASRLAVPMPGERDAGELLARIAGLPGVSYLGDALVTAREMADIERAALLQLRNALEGTFAVESRRSNTDFPVSSHEINVAVGAYLCEHTGRKVDLGSPDATVRIEVVQGSVYVYTHRVDGVGGLPVGTSGKVVALLSAGIDSPVAAWRMMKRGAVVVGLHFSGEPHTNDLSARLAVEIGHALEPHEGLGRIYIARFGEIQREISLEAPPALRVLLYRRLMLRIADAVAKREGARALVTGESLGQVASQTLENIAAVDPAAAMPVLRPLIGMDKNEIIAEARTLGTFEVSSRPHDDCCTLFMPRLPETKARIDQIEAAEAGLDVARMVEQALDSLTFEDFRCGAYRPRDKAERPSKGSDE